MKKLALLVLACGIAFADLPPVSDTLQIGAVANANGRTLPVQGYNSVAFTVNCASCSGGTQVNFEGSQDGRNFVSVTASNAAGGTASSTTTAGVTVWSVSVSGYISFRARVSAYSAGTVTVSATAVSGITLGPGGAVPMNADGSVNVNTTVIDPIAGITSPNLPASARWIAPSFTWYDEQPTFFSSSDGLHWAPLGAPGALYTPSSTYTRDTQLAKINGKYYLAHSGAFYSGTPTYAATATSVYIDVSTDLVTWSNVVTVAKPAGLSYVYAPFLFQDTDNAVYLYFQGNDQNIWVATASDATLATWGAAVKVNGAWNSAGSGNPGAIDPSVIKVGNTYQIWYAYQGSPVYIQYATSTSPTSGFTVAQSGNWASWGSGYEGPAIVWLGGGHYRVYFDKNGMGWYYSDSLDGTATWSAKVLASTDIHHSHPLFATDYNTQRDMLNLHSTLSGGAAAGNSGVSFAGLHATLAMMDVVTSPNALSGYQIGIYLVQDSDVTCTGGYGNVKAYVYWTDEEGMENLPTSTLTFTATKATGGTARLVTFLSPVPNTTLGIQTTYVAGTGCSGNGSTYRITAALTRVY